MAPLNPSATSLSPQVPAAEAYVQQLLREISGGHVELPSWSNQTEQVRTALDSDSVGIEHIARLLGSDAGLAMRVLSMANSALFARTTRPLMDLRLAVLRLGLENVRGAVYAHNVCIMTSVMGARAAVKAIQALREKPVGVRPIQSYKGNVVPA